MITHIKLEKFKRVIEFETDLDDINVLVGTNNSGKSSVLQGIQFTIMAEVARRVSGGTTVPQDRLLYLPSSDFAVLRHDSPYTNYSGATSSLTLMSDSETNDTPDLVQITLSKGRNFGNISINTSGNNNDIRTSLYRDGKLKKKAGEDEVRWPDFIQLFGTACPTSRKNVVGKFLLRKCNQNMRSLTDQQINLLTSSRALQIESLASILSD